MVGYETELTVVKMATEWDETERAAMLFADTTKLLRESGMSVWGDQSEKLCKSVKLVARGAV